MALRIDRFGNNYADNLLSYKMLFDNTDTWTVNSGTGSANTTLGNAFVGDKCLKIQNTDVVNDITVTNTTHATTINSTMTCGLSFYLYKKQALQAVIGNIKIFKNAVLLDTQTFTLGTDNADTDEDSVWVRFMSDQSYNFIKGDVITFTFTVDGIVGSQLCTLDLYIDGMMLYPMVRIIYVIPIYTRHVATLQTITENGSVTTKDITLADVTANVITVDQFRLSALNTPPSSASDTGTLGEIRIDGDYIYVCTATDTWKRVAIATW